MCVVIQLCMHLYDQIHVRNAQKHNLFIQFGITLQPHLPNWGNISDSELNLLPCDVVTCTHERGRHTPNAIKTRGLAVIKLHHNHFQV